MGLGIAQEIRLSLSKELIAATTTPLLLSLLDGEELYGYALIKRVRALSAERIAWSEGMLYPVLRRLETQGLIASRWQRAESGRRRRYYRLRKAGREELARQQEQWRLANSLLAQLWQEDSQCSI